MNAKTQANPAAFVVIGSLAAAIHLGTAFLLVDQAGIPPAVANVIAFGCAFFFSYAGHSRHSFRSGTNADGSFLRWLQVSIAGFLANQGLYMLALHAFPHVWYLLLSMLVTAIVASGSYLLGKLWAFGAA